MSHKLGKVAAFVLAVALMSLPAHAWQLALQAGVNSDNGVESEAAFSINRFVLEARARNFDASTFICDKPKCGKCGVIGGEDGALEWQVQAFVAAFATTKTVHGPVVNFTQHVNNDNTFMVGYRVLVRN